MQWSQLKKRVEATLAESVSGRVQLRMTRYHKAPDQMGRAWIVIDGHEITNMCSFTSEMYLWREAYQLRRERGCTDYRNLDQYEGYYAAWHEAQAHLREGGIFSPHEFRDALAEYLNLSIDRILTSPNPIVQAIGMLDRRLGKRRLAAMDASSMHPLVLRLYTFRCGVERLPQRDHQQKRYEYRVTKYNPRNRDGKGLYLVDEWVRRSQVGRSFNGVLFTEADYQKMEDAYVATALAFLQESGGASLRITALENHRGYQDPGLNLQKGAQLRPEEVARVCRLNLREAIWCKLEDDAGRFIHFGWDYYMYIGVPTSCDGAKVLARRLGLFVEPFASPYR